MVGSTPPQYYPYTQPMPAPKKRYELTDHLGNVSTVVTGKLLPMAGGGYQAEVVSAQSYEPFGSLLPGRNYSSDSYRYGFNGMRKDDEMHGATGTSYDFGARLYDPRVGRWLSLDPLAKKYPQWSPYQFVDGNPIRTIDIDGRDIIVLNDREGARGTGHAAVLIGSDETGWTYISKDGDSNGSGYGRSKFVIATFKTVAEFAMSQHNFVLAEGYNSDENGIANPDPVFALDEDGNKIQRFDRATRLFTTQANGFSTDAASIEAASESARSFYCLMQSDCSDVVTAALNAGQDSDGNQLRNGESSKVGPLLPPLGSLIDGYNERPNTKMDKIEKRNAVPALHDRALVPKSKELQSGERGKKKE